VIKSFMIVSTFTAELGPNLIITPLKKTKRTT